MHQGLRYQPDRDQRALIGELEASLAALLPLSRAQAGAHEDEAVWSELAELGVLALALPEEVGGSGLGAIELAMAAILLGRGLASPAVLASVALAPAVTRANGPGRIALGLPGPESAWIDEPSADLLLVRDGSEAALHALPADPRLLDDEVWGARLMTGRPGPELCRLRPDEVRMLRLVEAAALAGLAQAALDMAVGYAKLREQFGRPIGGFQAVKHHCANMAIAARGAQDLVTFAATALDAERADAARRVEAAALAAAVAAIDNAGVNIQIHGGMGFSAEAEPHLLIKRARLLAASVGGLDAASERLVAATLGDLAAHGLESACR